MVLDPGGHRIPEARNRGVFRLAIHGEARPQAPAWILGVEVAPALAPFGGFVLPAGVLAGEEELEAFSEAGLAGAVGADDEGQAGTGNDLKVRAWADAAEAGDGYAAQVGAGGGFGSAWARGWSLLAVALDDFVEGAVEGGDDVELGFVIQVAVRIKTVVDDGFDAVGHIAARCTGGVCTVLAAKLFDRCSWARWGFWGAAWFMGGGLVGVWFDKLTVNEGAPELLGAAGSP